MAINYPNGKKFVPPKEKPVKAKKKDFSFSNRGKTLEDELNETNDYYLQLGLAVIHKKPVPVQIVKVEYPSRSAAVIREAYFRAPSTTDYNGVWNGRYVDFEAKETENKTSFPLKNIHDHQIHHMSQVVKHQGLAFLIIRFSSLERYFIMRFEALEIFWNRMITGGRKSISLEEIEDTAVEIMPGAFPRIDYLPVLQNL
ncbi:Holliday junction resolvase [Planococcus glaciei]|jgi:recombination protein U|uniref:Holliday junction resolvase RecU n=1 Tax=Planococcus glaciei TaxID=459472 RepID=A0A1G8A1Y0_9BACL|nr:Holliday junction resolvase RecU [Planococcus glaciei]ETP70652.1 Holliday junction resolvase [Planococcus glaciei CHR43]KOF11284.1 Holliday junction resolvase [Planococcus glaciei]MBX0313933.1 Holliday junction resolvase RecU [Planococcus glaciei]QKX52379.1 Holliday junction resolvase RecU [Planococcus glaciei]SDH14952.1 recombination protein U [Planococcus glaciei]